MHLDDHTLALIFSFSSSSDFLNGLRTCKAWNQSLQKSKHIVKRLEIKQGKKKKFDQERLKKISEYFTGLEYLGIELQYSDDRSNILNWKKLYFPNLKTLVLKCFCLKNIYFTMKNTPNLVQLDISHSNADEIILNLANLTHMSLYYVDIDDGKSFGDSISKCKKLERFDSYKLWGLGGYHQKISIPNCKYFSLYRADDMQELSITNAPKLCDLNLQACYGMMYVSLPPVVKGEEVVPIKINVLNSGIDGQLLAELRAHPRCGDIRGDEDM
jgi:hypothetical protein